MPLESDALRVVAIGGSAGALDALRQMFEARTGATRLAFVVVIHHSPQHESVLDSLLGNWSGLPALRVDRRTALEPGRIFVAPPGAWLAFDGGGVEPRRGDPAVARFHPIDQSLASLAAWAGPRAACVILSGSGHDGAEGAAAIRGAGGRVVAQDPATSAHEGMPSSVVRAGLAHAVLPPAAMPAALAAWSGIGAPGAGEESAEGAGDDQTTQAIIDLVRRHAGNDLSGYKPRTLARRIARRAGLSRVSGLPEYLALVRESPGELDRLAKDMLIGVTAFFRDAEAFEVLEREVIPAICAAKADGEPVRVWIAGCSTGEEAYSVALLVHEWFTAHGRRPMLQLFATDIDTAALEVARGGRYPRETLEADLPPRLMPYFSDPRGGGLAISKSVRESIVFASHNLISDPPFSRLDLVVCRNVLIYLNVETQKRLLGLFRFVLKPGGALFLGSSESIGPGTEHFEPVSKPWRIFRRAGGDLPRQPPVMPVSSLGNARRTAGGGEIVADLGALAGQEHVYRRLMEASAPAQMLLNSRNEILFVSGSASRCLQVPPGEPTRDVFRLVLPALRVTLRAALSRAAREGRRVTASAVRDEAAPEGARMGYRITATPVPMETEEPLLLATIEEESRDEIAFAVPGAGGDSWLLRQLEQELDATREDLQRTIERMRLTNEETSAANEEIMAMNEELQSSNEELESSKEELQSLNEELATTNAALDNKVMELETTNTDLENLLLSAETATLFLDEALRIRRFTAACANLMRVIAVDVGRPLGDIVQTTGDGDVLEACRRVLAGEPVADLEVRNEDGRWFLRRALPYRAPDGRVRGVVLTYPDITAVKLGEAELASRAELLEWQADLLREAPVLARDMEDHIVFWNPGAEALYGWSREEALGKRSRALFASKLEVPFDQATAAVLATGRWKGRITHRCRDGRPIVVDSAWTLRRDRAGKAAAIIEVNNDVTERVAAEGQLAHYKDHLEEVVAQRTAELQEARQAAEAANRAKGAFLANMSHEIRTPLNAISGMAHLMHKAGLADEQAARLEKIESSSALLLEIIDAVLDLSKIEAGKFVVEMVPLRVEAIVEEVLSLLRDRAEAKGLRFAAKVGPMPSPLAGDATRLRQALVNLAGNAIKFTERGRVEIRATVVEDIESGALVRFEVEDTGIGIEAGALSRLFSAFEQADTSTTRRYGGSGLGLAITRKLAQLMGGEAGARSEPGAGSTFWFTARLAARVGEEPAPATEGETDAERVLRQRFAGRRILVVDDEPINEEITRSLLEGVGLEVESASNGLEAVERAGSRHYDIILMDMLMPQLDGLDATRRIRALPGHERTPIVAMTANAFAEDRARCLAAGMSDYLSKPFRPDRLYGVVARWLAMAKAGDA